MGGETKLRDVRINIVKRRQALYREAFSIRFLWACTAVAVLAALLLWLGAATPAETGHAPNDAVTVWGLSQPHLSVSTSKADDTTAFREEDAGFSAHYRVPPHADSDGLPRLNIEGITKALLEKPVDDKSTGNRAGLGSQVDSGANFGIIALPMFAAVGPGAAVDPTDVTVYYDDRGWVVAYLPPNAPAAGIWRYDSKGQQADDLKRNLLVLAINEVLDAARENGTPKAIGVTHETVGYYHWEYPKCNAMLLFSHDTKGSKSDGVRFVVPPTIKNIQASAAVLITSDQPDASAELMIGVDGADAKSVASVEQPARLNVSSFNLEREAEVTSLYEVTVSAEGGATAAGVVMLLYAKPGS